MAFGSASARSDQARRATLLEPRAPFALPLDRDGFASALRKGQGRALLHARRHGCAEFADLLVHALLHDLAYDAQCEDDRVPWLMEIFDASRCEERVVAEVVPLLDEPLDMRWDGEQRARVALALARRGNEEAARRLRMSLRLAPRANDVIAAREIVSLDGEAGLLRVAEFLGGLVQAGEFEVWPQQEWVEPFDEERGKLAARDALYAASATSPAIAAFLRAREEAVARRDAPDEERETKPKTKRRRLIEMSGDEAIERLAEATEERPGVFFSLWGRNAPPNDLLRFADAAFACEEPWRLAIGLRAFAARSAPPLVERLLPLADHPDAAVRSAAINALAQNESPAVRDLALRRLREGRVREGEIRLLAANFVESDVPIIESALAPAADPDDAHAIARDILAIADRNESRALALSLLFACVETPCGLCRERIAKHLLKRDAAPDWLREEFAADANDDIRAMVDGRVRESDEEDDGE